MQHLAYRESATKRRLKSLKNTVWVELARSHVLDHALTQRTDSGSVAHGDSILSEVDNTSISGRRSQLASIVLSADFRPLGACPHSRLERSDFVQWVIHDLIGLPRHIRNSHLSDMPTAPENVCSLETNVSNSRAARTIVPDGCNPWPSGASSVPSNQLFFNPPPPRVITVVGDPDPKTGERPPVYVKEPRLGRRYEMPRMPTALQPSHSIQVQFARAPPRSTSSITMCQVFNNSNARYAELIEADPGYVGHTVSRLTSWIHEADLLDALAHAGSHVGISQTR